MLVINQGGKRNQIELTIRRDQQQFRITHEREYRLHDLLTDRPRQSGDIMARRFAQSFAPGTNLVVNLALIAELSVFDPALSPNHIGNITRRAISIFISWFRGVKGAVDRKLNQSRIRRKRAAHCCQRDGLIAIVKPGATTVDFILKLFTLFLQVFDLRLIYPRGVALRTVEHHLGQLCCYRG